MKHFEKLCKTNATNLLLPKSFLIIAAAFSFSCHDPENTDHTTEAIKHNKAGVKRKQTND